MNEIYWLQVIGNISDFCMTALVVTIIALTLLTIGYCNFEVYDDNDRVKQAEKDLELTWEDMMLIHRCIKDAMNYHLYKMMEGVEGQKVVYQEVLKRYLKTKDK